MSLAEAPGEQEQTEHVDVLIVGAGLSGIGAACHLQRECPGRSFAIVEARGAIGGTWDLFRYPGIRSDSDMFTLGYVFKPWEEAKAIADGESIRRYIRAAAEEFGVAGRISFNSRVLRAGFSSRTGRWTVEIEQTDGDGAGETRILSCDFLFGCTGYYRYDEGFTPDFAGVENYRGSWCTHSTGPRTWTSRASTSWSSAAARRRSPSSPRWPAGRPM